MSPTLTYLDAEIDFPQAWGVVPKWDEPRFPTLVSNTGIKALRLVFSDRGDLRDVDDGGNDIHSPILELLLRSPLVRQLEFSYSGAEEYIEKTTISTIGKYPDLEDLFWEWDSPSFIDRMDEEIETSGGSSFGSLRRLAYLHSDWKEVVSICLSLS